MLLAVIYLVFFHPLTQSVFWPSWSVLKSLLCIWMTTQKNKCKAPSLSKHSAFLVCSTNSMPRSRWCHLKLSPHSCNWILVIVFSNCNVSVTSQCVYGFWKTNELKDTKPACLLYCKTEDACLWSLLKMCPLTFKKKCLDFLAVLVHTENWSKSL